MFCSMLLGRSIIIKKGKGFSNGIGSRGRQERPVHHLEYC